MDYAAISQRTISHLHASYASLKESPLDPGLRTLIELRISQINGCAYCIGVHTNEAKKMNVDEFKINALVNWEGSALFSELEKEVLCFVESLTKLPGFSYDIKKLDTYFSEREIVDLTICIALMNALNRLAICFK